MKTIHKKFMFGGVLLAVAIGYLGFASVKSGWVYYVEVDKFVEEAKFHTQRVKLCGTVAEEGMVSNPAGLSASFVLKGQNRSLPVAYRGVVPDLFAAGRDVVVEGKLDAAGTFQSDQMMTKCASKYEAGGKRQAGIKRSGE
jgi:cytochrome c-type biogenesis protein CcmE